MWYTDRDRSRTIPVRKITLSLLYQGVASLTCKSFQIHKAFMLFLCDAATTAFFQSKELRIRSPAHTRSSNMCRHCVWFVSSTIVRQNLEIARHRTISAPGSDCSIFQHKSAEQSFTSSFIMRRMTAMKMTTTTIHLFLSQYVSSRFSQYICVTAGGLHYTLSNQIK